jgi:GMP reductase
MKPALTFDDVSLIPQRSVIFTRSSVNISSSICGHPVSIPIIPSNMACVTGKEMLLYFDKIGAMAIMHRFQNYQEILWETLRESPFIRYGMSVGIHAKEITFIDMLIENKTPPEFIVVDVANGYLESVAGTVEKLKSLFDIPVIAGNICTYEGVESLVSAGASGIKVGIGNGSSCTTRLRTGVGIPQFTAIADCVCALEDLKLKDKITLISDGGVRTPGDVAKALAAGANIVMSGSLFAATDEAAPKFIRTGEFPNEQLFKPYFGSASENQKGDDNVEGNGRLLPYKGSCSRIIKGICDGLRSSMSYLNAPNLTEFYKNAEFVMITANGKREAEPYILK